MVHGAPGRGFHLAIASARVGLNPVVCGLVVTLVVDAVILYPVQTATNLLAFETG